MSHFLKRETVRELVKTDIAQVGLELGNPFVLRCVQDNREFRKVLLGLQGIFHPLFGDVADVDQFRCVVQEAAQASQPHQILFVFQLKTQSNVKSRATELYFTEKKNILWLFHCTSLVMSLTW